MASNNTPSTNSASAAAPLPKSHHPLKKTSIIFLMLTAIFILVYIDTNINHDTQLPLPGESVSYGLLFLAGLLTGFHCVGMCGAMVVSYTANSAKHGETKYGSHLLYGAGKTLSYTTIGALFGVLGAIITFTPYLRGMAGLIAGVFLLLFGLSMLNVFSRFNRFQIKTPKFVMKFIGKSVKNHSHPFMLGLLNGLMIICGPLQAMYILAAGTGSPMEGAKMLFVFGIGTLPVMLGFGMMASTLSRQMAPKLLKVSGVIVITLGIIMLNRGLTMTGSGYDLNSIVARMTSSDVEAHVSKQITEENIQVIHMDAGETYSPNQFHLRKGVPVKWIINGVKLHSCNHKIIVPKMDLEFDINEGKNIIEFTPNETGIMPWSCWMGMMPGAFIVHDENTDEEQLQATQPEVTQPHH